MANLPDLTEVMPEASFTLPIRGVEYTFRPCSAALGYVLTQGMTQGLPNLTLLPDDREAAQYRDLFGEHFDALSPLNGSAKLSHPEFQHIATTLVSWNLFGTETAKRVWTRTPELWAPAAADASSAGAPKSTGSSSGTSTTTARRSAPKRKRRR